MNIRKINTDSYAKFLALFISLSPFLWLYDLPVIHINVVFFPSILLSMFLAVDVLLKGTWKCSKTLIFPLVFFTFFYIIINYFYNSSEIIDKASTNITGILSLFLLLMVTSLAFKNKMFRDSYRIYVERIAIIMSAVIVIQYILFYVFHTTITQNRTFLFPFQNYFTEDVKQYLNAATMVSNAGLLRPSAFFLEPSYFGQFCSVALVSLLFRTSSLKNYKAIFVSAGIVLTTSGLGIATVMLLWGIALLFNNNVITKKVVLRIIMGMAAIVIMFCLMYLFIGPFKQAVNRIFIAYSGQTSAIEGRMWSSRFLNELSPTESFFGKNYKNIPVYGEDRMPYFMTGIVELLYCQGLLGTAVFLILYFWILLKSFLMKEKICFVTLMAYLPYLFMSNFLVIYFIIYIPFLVIDVKCKSESKEKK